MLRSKVLGRKIHVNTIEYDMKPYKYNTNIVTSKNTFKITHKDILLSVESGIGVWNSFL